MFESYEVLTRNAVRVAALSFVTCFPLAVR